MSPRPALAALLAALALPAAAAPAAAPAKATAPQAAPSKGTPPTTAPAPAPAPAPLPSRTATRAATAPPVMALHYMLGTGACAAPHSDTTQVDNPCWLQFGLAPALRLGAFELGLAYEGRDLLKWVTFTLLEPPAVTTVGASAAWIHEPDEKWRLSAGGEFGWRRYMDFAGTGTKDRSGAIDLPYVGAVGRAALGVHPGTGRADRLEVSVAVRADLKTGHATVDGADWSAGGWSFTMSLGLVSEW